jgi:hypothetical protein
MKFFKRCLKELTTTVLDLQDKLEGKLQVFPNPADNGLFRAEFELRSAGEVQLVLYDGKGRCIKDLLSKYLTDGRHQIVIEELKNVPSGAYYLTLTDQQGVLGVVAIAKNQEAQPAESERCIESIKRFSIGKMCM